MKLSENVGVITAIHSLGLSGKTYTRSKSGFPLYSGQFRMEIRLFSPVSIIASCKGSNNEETRYKCTEEALIVPI